MALEASQLHFLADVTAADAFGQPVMSQQIFDATLALIATSRDLLVLDYFLFDRRELRDALLARKQAAPELPILVLVDPINSAYGPQQPPDLAALQAAGIEVVTTNLDPLRDSNALYSAAWRLLLKGWLTPTDAGSLPNLLDARGPPVSVGAYARLLNLKANHRKLVLTGDGRGGLRGLLTSANPHAASSAHSNVGLALSGPALLPLLDSELAIARFSGWRGRLPRPTSLAAPAAAGPLNEPATAVVLTEGAIRDALLARLESTHAPASVDIAQFYLSDRPVIRSLLAAARRGVTVRVLLDPNKDAFGHEKSGLPNRQVAAELVAASDGAIRVRWYRTHGEQFHAKLVAIQQQDRSWISLGSANLTRRNLGDFNLEANVIVEVPARSALAQDVAHWFERLWTNRAVGGIEYTADVDVYADPSQGRYWLYRFLEASGLSTF